MRINGLSMLVSAAVSAIDDPVLSRYRAAVVLGALREDVMYVPILGRVVEHFSLSHLYGPPWPGGFVPLVTPGPRLMGRYHFARAVRAYRAGDRAAGFVKLGRVAHLLADMACPVHVHRYVHDTDLFEWYVESHRDQLLALPAVAEPVADSPAQLIAGLARYTAGFPGDPTQSLVGRLLKRRGLLRAVSRADVARHAQAIMPTAIAYMTGLLRLYLAAVRER